VLGTAKVMSYEDLEKAKAERAAKEAQKAEREAKKAKREAKRAEKEAKKAAKEAEEATAGKSTRGRKRKSPAAADAPEPKAKVSRMSVTLVAEDETAPTPWRAPSGADVLVKAGSRRLRPVVVITVESRFSSHLRRKW
jgi:sRNA-binding protein